MADSNYISKVAIVGASGRIGTAFATSLLATGKHTVTALTRKGSSRPPVAGTKVIPVDYDDEASLVSALQGQQFLIITLSVRSTAETHTRLVKAAGKAGVPYVMPNIYGGDYLNKDISDDHFMSDFYKQRLADFEGLEGTTSYVVLVCGQWYEWSLGLPKPWYGFDIRKRELTLYDAGTTKINTSTWDQCGRAVAALLSLPLTPPAASPDSPSISAWRNKPLYISSFLVSQKDMLASLNRVLGTSDADWKIDSEPTDVRYKRGMEEMKNGIATGFATALYARAFAPGAGDFESKYGLANEVLGLPREDFDEITRRTVTMVEEGFVEKTFAAFGRS